MFNSGYDYNVLYITPMKYLMHILISSIVLSSCCCAQDYIELTDKMGRSLKCYVHEYLKDKINVEDEQNRHFTIPLYKLDNSSLSEVKNLHTVHRAKSITIPSVSFSSEPLSRVTETLTELSKIHDPSGQGITIMYPYPRLNNIDPLVSSSYKGLSLWIILDLLQGHLKSCLLYTSPSPRD